MGVIRIICRPSHRRIGELTRSIKGKLEESYASVWVEGEVSNLSRPSSGHVYLTLQDERAAIDGVV